MFSTIVSYFEYNAGSLIPGIILCAAGIVCLAYMLIQLLKAPAGAQGVQMQDQGPLIPPYQPFNQAPAYPQAPTYPETPAYPQAPAYPEAPASQQNADNPVINLPADDGEDSKTESILNKPALTLGLTELTGEGRSLQFSLNPSFTIGRTEGRADVVFGYEPSVSGLHCRIFAENGRVFVQDLQSTNHTFVNGVMANDTLEIPNGAELVLGNLRLRVNY